MTSAGGAGPSLLTVKVELFGTARLVSRRRQVEVSVPPCASASDVAAALAEACPELVGKAVRSDGSGLMPSYTLNLNGRTFLADKPVELRPGDSLLLFSSQAGG